MRFAIIPSLPAAGRPSEVRFCIARLLCDESRFDQNAKKREIPHPGEAHGARKPRFADSARNDEFEVFGKLLEPFTERLLRFVMLVAVPLVKSVRAFPEYVRSHGHPFAALLPRPRFRRLQQAQTRPAAADLLVHH